MHAPLFPDVVVAWTLVTMYSGATPASKASLLFADSSTPDPPLRKNLPEAYATEGHIFQALESGFAEVEAALLAKTLVSPYILMTVHSFSSVCTSPSSSWSFFWIYARRKGRSTSAMLFLSGWVGSYRSHRSCRLACWLWLYFQLRPLVWWPLCVAIFSSPSIWV